MLLSTYDMGNSHEMIVYCSREVVQRPDTILGPDPWMRILLWIYYSESWPVSNRWIRVSCLCLDANHRFSFFQFSAEHLVPQFEIFSRTPGPMWTSPA